jgi:hypothetical protein
VRRKVNPRIAIFGHKLPKADLSQLKQIYAKVEDREKRDELNLYVSGYEDEPEPELPAASSAPAEPEAPADKSPTFPGPGEQPEPPSSESEPS